MSFAYAVRMRLAISSTTFLAWLLAACASTPTTTGGADASTAALDASVSDAGSKDSRCAEPNTPSSTNCGTLSWETSETKSRPRNHHVTLLATTKAGPALYVLGGVEGSKELTSVDRITLSKDGVLGESVETTPMPMAMGGHVGVVVPGAIFVAGGMGMSGVSNESHAAPLLDDGSVGAWKMGPSVLQKRMHAGAFASGNTVYVLGGFDDPNVWDDIVRTTVDPSGTIAEFSSAGKLPGPLSHFGLIYANGYVYVTGGLDKSAYANPPARKDVHRGRLKEDGTIGDWSAMPPLPRALATHGMFLYGGYVYVVAGIQITGAANQEKAVWRAPLLPDHGLGPWEASAPLPMAKGHAHHAPVFGTHVYSVGGAVDFALKSTDAIHVGTFTL